jgi:NADH-quinone oxidoreductase subunit N
MNDQLNNIYDSTLWLAPELVITAGIIITFIAGLLIKGNNPVILKLISLGTYLTSILYVINHFGIDQTLFGGMLKLNEFSSYFKILFLTGGIITTVISEKNKEGELEYYTLILSVVLGSSLLAMSTNFIMVVLSLELISLSSYLLAGFGFDKTSSEGSLKYFLFGSIATACMIYGLSLIYGISGSLDFSSDRFVQKLVESNSPLILIGGLLTLSGFLFKVSAVPFHLWTPDVYESAPTPLVAFFSVVPKLAGIAILTKFTLAINLFGQSGYPWQNIVATISILSILIGNLSALAQEVPKRMLAYSSIAQSGFILIGISSFNMEGVHFMLFYSTIFLVMNFLVFIALIQFENSWGHHLIPSYAGMGKILLIPSLSILVAFVSLTGLPPTAGFTAKLLIFTSLWQSYQQNHNILILTLFIVGLVNTVVSLFFYLKIPYYLFIKEKKRDSGSIKPRWYYNFLSIILVILLFYFFLAPYELMGWINRINFVL